MTTAAPTPDLAGLKSQIDFLKRSQDLETGRNEVLRMVASGKDLELILNVLCQKAQIYQPEMHCSILLYDHQSNTLHPIASVDLPLYYSDALDGISPGPSIGSCGTAIFTKKRVVVEDINTHPYWSAYKELALSANLQACWSEPIIGRDGKVYGTFAMYYEHPTSPTKDDLHFIEVSANLAAVVFETDAAHNQLIKANELLNQTIDQRNEQLEQTNQALTSALEQRNKIQLGEINAERVQTTSNLLTGFAHEINTPVGTAVTAISAAERHLQQLMDIFTAGKLTRKQMAEKVGFIKESIALNKKSLVKTTDLLSKFKEINFDLSQAQSDAFLLDDLFAELPSALATLLKGFTLELETEDITLPHSKNAFWQMLYQLIENSVVHGFAEQTSGLILISAARADDNLIIHYQDDGRGIPQEYQHHIFEPFFSTKRTRGSIGLGLSIVSNIITNTFGGTIRLIHTPVGCRMEITMPLD